MPSVKKIRCESGLVHFTAGIPEQQIQEFLEFNKIQRVKDSPKIMITGGDGDGSQPIKSIATIKVPPAEQYIVPDHVWVWIERDLHK